jgi:single-stranded-DNA-specific exonuclease
MEKRGILEKELESFTKKFLESAKNKEVLVISHFDTDGISSASILIKTLKKKDQRFSIKILKSLDNTDIENFPEDKILLFSDLGSGSLTELSKRKNPGIYILDHHEITQEIPKNINIINPELYEKQKISSSGLCYLFAKQIDPSNKELAKLAILGMIGDMLDKEIDRLNNGILQDGEIKRKRGLLLYPATRPINRTLEYSSYPYIPGVTGDIKGVLELLRECGISPENGKYPRLLDIEGEEMSRLITSVMLRMKKDKTEELVGDIFLIKHLNKLEDARELSAKINACSRMGETSTAILFCMEIAKTRKKAESIHVKYRQNIISGLNYIKENTNIQGENFVIINAKDNIKDTIIGTLASIISHSPTYEEGTVIITMAYRRNKIKISSRNAGRKGRNVREILSKVITDLGENCEIGGHHHAAGCLIDKQLEEPFTKKLQENLQIETKKIQTQE